MFRVNHCFRNRFTDTTHFLTSFWIFTSWDWLCFWCFFFRRRWSSFSLEPQLSLQFVHHLQMHRCQLLRYGHSYQYQLLYECLHLFTSVFTNRWHSNYALIYYFCSCRWSSFRRWSFYCRFFSF